MSRPQWDKAKVEAILQQQFDAARRKMPRVVILGVRGYFQDSMGVKGQNDRGIYDDAAFIYSPLYFRSFNFNTDPSRHGMNEEGKGLAVLQPGIWDYKIGIHGMNKPKELQYRAFVQAGQVLLDRDGEGGVEKGFFGINIHRGGINGTSSLGCQTTVRDQWDEFFNAAETELTKFGQNIVPYVLIEARG